MQHGYLIPFLRDIRAERIVARNLPTLRTEREWDPTMPFMLLDVLDPRAFLHRGVALVCMVDLFRELTPTSDIEMPTRAWRLETKSTQP
jgi:hypothetical protein